MSHVTCYVYKVVELVSGASVINGAYHIKLLELESARFCKSTLVSVLYKFFFGLYELGSVLSYACTVTVLCCA